MDTMDMKNGNGADLAVRAMDGDGEAFGRLIETHYRSVFAIAYSRIQKWDVAEDLAQDTFLTAWQHRESLRDSAKFPAWVMQITRNLARNWLRSKTYRRQLAERAESEAVEPDTGAPQEKVAIMGEWDDAVDKAIAALPENMREAVVLYYLHEESAEETGRLLGISAAAVRKRTQRARELMRVHLEKDWESTFAARSKTMPVRQRAARVSALLALPPVSAPLAKAAAVDAAASIATTGTGMSAALGIKVAGVLVVLSVLGVGFGASLGIVPTPKPERLTGNESAPTEIVEMNTAPQEEIEATAEARSSDRITLVEPADAPIDQRDANAGGVQYLNSVAGHVVDVAGNPVASATVSVFPSLGVRYWGYAETNDTARFITSATTDGDGRFHIAGIPGGTHYGILATMSGYTDSAMQHFETVASVSADHKEGVRPEARGLAPAGAERVEAKSATFASERKGKPDYEFELVLQPLIGAELHARLLDEHGQPMAHAVVDCKGFVDENGSIRAGGGNTAVTDADGNLSLDVPDHGRATLVVRGSDGTQAVLRDVPVDPANRVTVTSLESAALEGVISGVVPEGSIIHLESVLRIQQFNPSGGAKVTSATSGPSYAAAVSPDGTYRIEGISVELDYKFAVVDSEGTNLTPQIPILPFESGDTSRFDYTLSERTRLAGTIRGERSGEPLRDLAVRWRSIDKPELGDLRYVGEDGGYNFDLRLGPGRYIVYGQYRTLPAPELEEKYGEIVTLEPGTDINLDLTFQDPVRRTIIAVDEAGALIEGADIGYCVENSHWGWGLQTDADGMATYAAIVPGEVVHFEVNKFGYLPASTTAFAGNSGDVFDPETVVLMKRE